MLAALAVLSETLVAQETVASKLILDWMVEEHGGGGRVVEWVDVIEVGKGLFEKVS